MNSGTCAKRPDPLAAMGLYRTAKKRIPRRVERGEVGPVRRLHIRRA